MVPSFRWHFLQWWFCAHLEAAWDKFVENHVYCFRRQRSKEVGKEYYREFCNKIGVFHNICKPINNHKQVRYLYLRAFYLTPNSQRHLETACFPLFVTVMQIKTRNIRDRQRYAMLLLPLKVMHGNTVDICHGSTMMVHQKYQINCCVKCSLFQGYIKSLFEE